MTKLKVFYYFFLSLSLNAFANAKSDTFARFRNEYFIETGSYQGGGVEKALEAGYKHVYSIEILPQYHNFCLKKFKGNSRVHLILGDSVKIFPQILKQIDRPATFWLDAHFCSYDGKRRQKGYMAKTTSLKEELIAIRNHPIKTHTILIDDVRLFESDHMERITLSEVKSLLRSINPNYQIYRIDGSFPNDILVATP
ncbi:MAG: hypothetical protein K9M07_05105 [Simkaniaceae bacterium]|nr:hypothetical protein [Simkaniaceae bacterium]